MKTIAILLGLTTAALAQQPDFNRKTTLGEVRRAFLNQRVVISGHVMNMIHGPVLDWYLARPSGGDYQMVGGLDCYLAPGYNGQTATVIAIPLRRMFGESSGPNALGETTSEDATVNPYFDIIVRFDDGTLAMNSAYASTLYMQVSLAGQQASLEEHIHQELSRLIGSTVYAAAFSPLYQPDTTLEDMTGRLADVKRTWDAPLFQPLTVTAAKYIPSTGIVFKVQLPSGAAALSFTEPFFYTQANDKSPFVQQILGSLLRRIDPKFTPREVEAIQHRTLFRGMSKDAVEYSVGLKDKGNDWGRGGEQWIFDKGNMIVYIDAAGKVEDWQMMNTR